MAYVTAPDGTPGEVPDEKAPAAFKAGYKPRQPTADELLKKQAAEQPVQAAAEGFLRGASFGVSDPLLKVLGGGGLEGYQRTGTELKARKEENPWASGVAEVGGAVGVSALTGGGASALAGGGLKGAVFEGGMYGMGSMVSESALENRELTSDRLAAGLVGGGLASGAFHGGFSAIGKGVSLGMSKFGGGGLKGALNEAANSIEKRALAEGQAGLVKRLERQGGNLDDVVQFAREKKLPIRFTQEAVDDVKAVLEGTHGETRAALKTADAIRPLSNDAYRSKFLADVEQKLTDQFDGDIASKDAVRDFLKDEIRPLVNDTALTRDRLYTFQSKLRKRVDGFGENSIKKDVYNAGRKLLRNNIFDDVGSITPGEATRLQRLQKDYAKGSFLQDAMTTRLAKNEATGGVTGIGMMDVLRGGGYGGSAGAAIAGSIGAPLGALVGAYANKAIREKGGSIAASALRSLADSSVTNGVSRALGAHLSQVLAVAPEALGAFRFPLAAAAAQGTDALLQEHIRLASSPEGSRYLSTVALPVESPEDVQAAGGRLAVLDALERSTAEHQSQLDSAVDSLFGSAAGRKASLLPPTTLKDFFRVSESLQKVISDPTEAFKAVPPEISAGAPGTAADAAAKLVRMAQYLDSKMPKDPNAGMPPSVAPPWEPSKYDMDKFNRYREAVEQPARVLKNMAAGFISAEQVEAIQAVYPALYADLQQKIGERLMMQKKPLSYQQRLAMSAIIGPVALGMSQAQMQVLQQSQMTMKTGADQAGGGMKKPDGRQDVNAEDNLDTQATRLEKR